MNNKQKLALAKEVQKRKKLADYEGDFELFSKEQIKILTKDSSMGFIPFEFNEAQSLRVDRWAYQPLQLQGCSGSLTSMHTTSQL